MEGGESIFDAIFEEEDLEDVQDVEMLDVEEGELIEKNSQSELKPSSGGDVHVESRNKNQRRKDSKRKNKRKKGSSGKGGSGPNITDINRFVLDVCKRLKERKSYLVWTAVGCLGVSALSDLVKEVDAIQACGGQKTADGRRFRTGGGILWSILKARDPNAYKEIMRKGKDFEKHFNQRDIRPAPVQNEQTTKRIAHASTDQTTISVLDGAQLVHHVQNLLEPSNVGLKRTPVRDRIRVPVTHEDLLGAEDPKDVSS